MQRVLQHTHTHASRRLHPAIMPHDRPLQCLGEEIVNGKVGVAVCNRVCVCRSRDVACRRLAVEQGLCCVWTCATTVGSALCTNHQRKTFDGDVAISHDKVTHDMVTHDKVVSLGPMCKQAISVPVMVALEAASQLKHCSKPASWSAWANAAVRHSQTQTPHRVKRTKKE